MPSRLKLDVRTDSSLNLQFAGGQIDTTSPACGCIEKKGKAGYRKWRGATLAASFLRVEAQNLPLPGIPTRDVQYTVQNAGFPSTFSADDTEYMLHAKTMFVDVPAGVADQAVYALKAASNGSAAAHLLTPDLYVRGLTFRSSEPVFLSSAAAVPIASVGVPSDGVLGLRRIGSAGESRLEVTSRGYSRAPDAILEDAKGMLEENGESIVDVASVNEDGSEAGPSDLIESLARSDAASYLDVLAGPVLVAFRSTSARPIQLAGKGHFRSPRVRRAAFGTSRWWIIKQEDAAFAVRFLVESGYGLEGDPYTPLRFLRVTIPGANARTAAVQRRIAESSGSDTHVEVLAKAGAFNQPPYAPYLLNDLQKYDVNFRLPPGPPVSGVNVFGSIDAIRFEATGGRYAVGEKAGRIDGPVTVAISNAELTASAPQATNVLEAPLTSDGAGVRINARLRGEMKVGGETVTVTQDGLAGEALSTVSEAKVIYWLTIAGVGLALAELLRRRKSH